MTQLQAARRRAGEGAVSRFALRFPLADVGRYAAGYDNPQEANVVALMAASRARPYLTHAELAALGEWKSPRVRSRLAANDPAYVEAVTGVALTTDNERLRIEALTLLRGVAWPMASTILHWCHPDPYPILDYRALWSLGIDTPPRYYDFPFWWAYVEHCRALAAEAGVSMRELDRALWQFSWERG